MSMKDIEESIARLYSIPCLKPDWDDAGAQPVAMNTLEIASTLLRAMGVQWPAASVMRAPVMGPCPDGSVDLHWTNPQMLINVNSEGEANFYFEGGRSGCNGTAYIGAEANLLYWAHAFAHLASMVDLSQVPRPDLSVEDSERLLADLESVQCSEEERARKVAAARARIASMESQKG